MKNLLQKKILLLSASVFILSFFAFLLFSYIKGLFSIPKEQMIWLYFLISSSISILFSLILKSVLKKEQNILNENLDDIKNKERIFISCTAHELNNPLTAIRGECEITLLKERNVEQYKEALIRIESETNRIIQLIKQLRLLIMDEQEILKQGVEPILMVDFLRSFEVNDITFTPDSYILTVEANMHLLRVAIENIINNARKYSDGKPVTMRLSGSVLEIEDNGIGIPPEELKYIEQPFFRASNTRGFRGNGVGLSLALKILKIFGAKIVITSTEGSGTLFQIDFKP